MYVLTNRSLENFISSLVGVLRLVVEGALFTNLLPEKDTG